MINDNYAITYLNPDDEAARNEFSRIINTCAAAGVTNINFSLPFDFSINVPSNLAKLKLYSSLFSLNKLSKKLSAACFFTVNLIDGLSQIPDLAELAVRSKNNDRLFLAISPGIDTDIALHELHNIIYKLKLTPVITAYPTTRYYLDDRLSKALLNIPNCIYQIDLSSLTDKLCISALQDLYKADKTLIFGSGSRFDANIYSNIDYYEKRIRSVVGKDNYGYFSLLHNKLF